MTLRLIRRLAIAGAAIVAVGSIGAPAAQAAILITVSEGATTAYTYTNGNSGAFIGSVGNYQFQVNTANTNFPGNTLGTLSTTVNVSMVSGTPSAPLVVNAYVVNDGGANASPFGVTGAPPAADTVLATFLHPTGNPLSLMSSITSTASSSQTSDMVGFSSTANGVTVATADISVPSLIGAQKTGAFNGATGYTLSNQTTLTLAAGDQGVVTSGASTVATPEPGTFALAFTALPLLGLAYRRRSRPRAC